MRVVSLVPSWTETLLECGVEVVGRTRFCVHPEEKVRAIPILGGTKDLDAARLDSLAPDLLLLDREENLAWMAEGREFPVHASHVREADDVPRELEALAKTLRNEKLFALAGEWRELLAAPAYPQLRVAELPGVVRWLREPKAEPSAVIYLIWRGPWMAVSRDTFVGSMLSQVGFGGRIPPFTERYPKIDLSDFPAENTLLLFASEPYPFAKKAQELLSLDFPSAIVDGEVYSWFGVRSLRFLQASRKH